MQNNTDNHFGKFQNIHHYNLCSHCHSHLYRYSGIRPDRRFRNCWNILQNKYFDRLHCSVLYNLYKK